MQDRITLASDKAVKVLTPECVAVRTFSVGANWVAAIPYVSTISSLLTLFSKFFSSFLRSTCSLSVSHQYLALEEVYLPFKASLPKNPTLRNLSSRWFLRQRRECHPLCFPVPWDYARNLLSEKSFRLQFANDTSLEILTLSFCRFSRPY